MGLDETDMLRAALARRMPAPSPERRARILDQLQKNLAERQASDVPARPIARASMETGPIWQKMEAWMSKWKKRGVFLGTSGLVTASLAMVVVVNLDMSNGSVVSHDRDIGQLGTDEPSGLVVESTASIRQKFGQMDLQASKKVESFTGRTVAGKATPGRSVMMDVAQTRSVMQVPAVIPEPIAQAMPGDRFEKVDPSSVKIAADDPVSTFSIDVDTASYTTLRSYLERGQIPPEDAIRVEEMINYFSYDYAAPEAGGDPFATHVTSFETPWNEQTRLVHIGLQGVMPEVEDRPALDLVFLVDTSGSMQAADKLGLLKQSLKLMLPQLRPEDRVAVVTYAGSAGVALDLTSASEVAKISTTLDGLAAGGGTAGAAGLRTAYDLLDQAEDEDRIGRVILATDGDFNVGMSGVDEMKDFISGRRERGDYLSVLGFGHGNYNDALMQTLAQNGNGHAAYIDSLTEARKALGDQLTGALFPIAGDVKVQVEFNPSVVGEYRLIGYETRALAREDFNNDKVDAGDLGAGHSVTALYEVTPVGSPALLNDPLRYGEAPAVSSDADELGFVKLRWKAPGESESRLVSTSIPNSMVDPGGEHRFAAAIAGFGQLLKGGAYLGDWGVDEAIALATSHDGRDEWGLRAEAVRLMALYRDLKSIEH